MEISGYISLFAAMIVSRIINERGYRVLSDEEKVRLMDGFSKSRAYSFIPLLVLIGGYWLLTTKTDLDRKMLSTAYFGLLIAFVVVKNFWDQRKLTALNLPAAYRRYFTIAQVVSLIGVTWFFYTIFDAKSSRAARTQIHAEASGR
jgi:hypothetical protein